MPQVWEIPISDSKKELKRVQNYKIIINLQPNIFYSVNPRPFGRTGVASQTK
jgi:hypothetical protein